MGKFLKHIELDHDEFLDSLSKTDRVRIIGAFAQAIRDRDFSRSGPQELASGMCKEAMDKMSEVFRVNYRCDPRHGESDKEDNGLELLYKGYTNNDPAPKQQKALTLFFYR